jgi:hypothetical protein
MFDRNLSIESTAGVLQSHGARLRSLLGMAIDATCVAWDVERDEWFADEAVILDAGDSSLEIVCWKLSDIVLSWRAIDRAQPPSWVGDWGPEFKLEWRRDAIAALREACGRQVRGINVVEYLHRTTVVDDRRNPANVGRRNEAWLLHGLEFLLEGMTLGVFNALDQNGVTIEPFAGEEFRRVPV